MIFEELDSIVSNAGDGYGSSYGTGDGGGHGSGGSSLWEDGSGHGSGFGCGDDNELIYVERNGDGN